MARPSLPPHLNVCIVARNFPVAGRATEHSFLRLIARGLVQKGHRVTVLAGNREMGPHGKPELEQDGVKVFFVTEGRSARRSSAFRDAAKAKFTELHRAAPFHLLHSVDSSAYRIARYKAKYGIAVAYDVEATRMSQLFAILGMGQETLGGLLATAAAVAYTFLRDYFGGDRPLLKTADGVFVTSPQQRIVLERYYLFPDARIYSVPYGIEIGDLAPRETSEELRAKLGLSDANKVAVTISDMADASELTSLLQAFERVAIKKPNARLIIVGSGPKFREIEYQALMLALGNRVIMTGPVKSADVPEYVALSDVFVNLSARTTGFEPSLLEAMAQKKIIIGSEASPISTIVEHGQDGFLIRPADAPELAALLLDVFNGHLPALEIGDAARRKVLNLFDPEKMVIQTINAYYDILKSTGLYRKR